MGYANNKSTQFPALVLTEYVYFLARIAIADRQLFLQLVSATAAALNLPEAQIWEPILNQWWTRVRLPISSPPSSPVLTKNPFPSSPSPSSCSSVSSCSSFVTTSSYRPQFDNMSEPHLRKLTAMGIANLVSTGGPEVLDRLSTEICNLWIDVFGEIKEAQSNAENECVLCCVPMAVAKISDHFEQPIADAILGPAVRRHEH